MGIYWKDDKLLFGPDDKIAFSDDCCCNFLCKQLRDCFHVIGSTSHDTLIISPSGIINQICHTCADFNQGYISTLSSYGELTSPNRCIIGGILPGISSNFRACTINYQIRYTITLFPDIGEANLLVDLISSGGIGAPLWTWSLTGVSGFAALLSLCSSGQAILPLIVNNTSACDGSASICTLTKP